MSIVLNVHPGVQLYTRGCTAKNVFAVRSRKGPTDLGLAALTVLAYSTSLQDYKSFQDWAEISKALILLVRVNYR